MTRNGGEKSWKEDEKMSDRGEKKKNKRNEVGSVLLISQEGSSAAGVRHQAAVTSRAQVMGRLLAA